LWFLPARFWRHYDYIRVRYLVTVGTELPNYFLPRFY
jgi:hypothetical protein